MPKYKVHWGGTSEISADNEDHAKWLFLASRRDYTGEVEVHDVEALPSDEEPGLRETFIRLGQHR